MADTTEQRPPPYNYGATTQNYAVPPPYTAPGGYQDAGKPGYPPSQPIPHPGHPATTATIITQPQTVVVNVLFGEAPVSMVCPYCQTHIVSSTRYEDGTLTWLAAGGLCLIGCWLGCCLIPFCVDGCKDVTHSCPNCQARLGVYRRT